MAVSFSVQTGTLLRVEVTAINNDTRTTGVNPAVPGKLGHVVT